MSITTTISGTTLAVPPSADTEFTTTGPFVLYGDNFTRGASAILYRLGPSGQYLPITNKDGMILVSNEPNTVYIDVKGTFRIKKEATMNAASVGYEEV